MKVYSADSAVRHPRRFLREAAGDFRASRSTAKRLFRQTIVQRYRYSSLGLLWAFAPPVVTALLLTLSKRELPSSHHASFVAPQLYAVFGLMLAQTFLETFNTQRNLFSNNRHLLSRQRATIETVIMAGGADNVFSLCIKLAILAGFLLLFHTPPAATLPLGLLGVGSVALLGSGLGLLLAPMNALKPDLDHIMTFFPWILFGLTPIFVQVPPSAGWNQIYRLNPLAWIFDATRTFTYGQPSGHGLTLAVSIVVSAAVFCIGAVFCRIAHPHIAERLLK